MIRNLLKYGFPRCEYCGGWIMPWALLINVSVRGKGISFSHRSCQITAAKVLLYWQPRFEALDKEQRRCEISR
jgi:hypothetical protein